VLLYVPLTTFSYFYLIHNGMAGVLPALPCLALSPILEVWFAFKRAVGKT